MNWTNTMRPLILTFLCLMLMVQNSAEAKNADIPSSVTQFSFENLAVIADNTLKVEITVMDTQALELFKWRLSPADMGVFYKKLAQLPNKATVESNLDIPNPESGYRGLEVAITNKYGEQIEPFTIYNGALKTFNGEKLMTDPNRDLEYTLWGLNYSPKNQRMMVKMLPIIDFDQCVKLGNKMVPTTPRQCLLKNGEIFLDVAEKPTQESITIRDFDECLVKGQAIINTFPRRCIAAGGHVFAEPPRVK